MFIRRKVWIGQLKPQNTESFSEWTVIASWSRNNSTWEFGEDERSFRTFNSRRCKLFASLVNRLQLIKHAKNESFKFDFSLI